MEEQKKLYNLFMSTDDNKFELFEVSENNKGEVERNSTGKIFRHISEGEDVAEKETAAFFSPDDFKMQRVVLDE